MTAAFEPRLCWEFRELSGLSEDPAARLSLLMTILGDLGFAVQREPWGLLARGKRPGIAAQAEDAAGIAMLLCASRALLEAGRGEALCLAFPNTTAERGNAYRVHTGAGRGIATMGARAERRALALCAAGIPASALPEAELGLRVGLDAGEEELALGAAALALDLGG